MSIQFKQKTKQGFTLVELSIVIVIIGFLVAGIASASNMIKQAQLRSVISDLQSYQASYNNFIAKYNKYPGDMNTASSFWPNTCAESNVADACNGDGNGKITGAPFFDNQDEVRAALKHLSLANMISGGIPPVAEFYSTKMIAGVNAPNSKISGAGYMIVSGSPFLDTSRTFPPISGFSEYDGNVLYIGKSGRVTENLVYGALTPAEAFNMDQKMDDAVISGSQFIGAVTGKIRTMDGRDGAAHQTSGDDCVLLDLTTPYRNEYYLGTDRTMCLLGFALDN